MIYSSFLIIIVNIVLSVVCCSVAKLYLTIYNPMNREQAPLSDMTFSSVQSLSRVQLFVTPWIATRQASLSITNSRSLLKLMSIKSVMPSKHLILCHALLFLPSIFPSFRVSSNESVLCIRWPKYWSFSFSISPSNGYSGLISWISIAMDRSPRNIFLFDGEHGENW